MSWIRPALAIPSWQASSRRFTVDEIIMQRRDSRMLSAR
jgi:hypothetical protein